MEIVSAREFRSNQGKFLSVARKGHDLVLTSRYGNFRIVPIKEDDTLMNKDAYLEKIERAIDEVQKGNIHPMKQGESLDDFLVRMEAQGNV